MNKIKISALIIVKNEERCIFRCLKSLEFVDEVILVDSGSDDSTLRIAKKFKNVHIFEKEWQGYAKQKEYALSLCSHEVCLSLDADEWLSEKLVNEIESLNWDEFDGFFIDRSDSYKGRFPPSIVKKEKGLRLFRKSKAHFKNVNVHETVVISSNKIGQLENFYFHDGYDDPKVLWSKNKYYASLKAEKKGILYIIEALLRFILIFIKEYFLKRKMFWGIRGFELSIIHSYYSAYKVWFGIFYKKTY